MAHKTQEQSSHRAVGRTRAGARKARFRPVLPPTSPGTAGAAPRLADSTIPHLSRLCHCNNSIDNLNRTVSQLVFPGSFLCLRRGLVSKVAAIVPTPQGPGRRRKEPCRFPDLVPTMSPARCVAVAPDFTGFLSKRRLDCEVPERRNSWRKTSQHRSPCVSISRVQSSSRNVPPFPRPTSSPGITVPRSPQQGPLRRSSPRNAGNPREHM